MTHYQRLQHDEISKILSEMNAIHTGHFVGTSGAHLDAYVNKDAPGSDPQSLMKLAFELAHRIRAQCDLESDDVTALVGAPMGAISLGVFTAYWLNELFPRKDGVKIKSFYAEKTSISDDDAPFKLRPFYSNQIKGRGVVGIEDILNTGKSGKKTTALIQSCGGTAVGIAALCNRGKVTDDQLNTRFLTSLLDLDLVKWNVQDNETCPLCLRRMPMNVKLGHGQKFVDQWNTAHAGDSYPVVA